MAGCLLFTAGSANAYQILDNGKSKLAVSGYADLYIEYLNDSGADTSRARMSSGGMSSSRISLRGSHKLDNGMEAFFRVGKRFNIDDGSVTDELRQSYVGLRGDWGSLSFGKQFTTAYNPVGYADPNWTSAYSMMNNMVWFYAPYVKKNSLFYQSPEFGGFSANVMYAFGDEGGENGRFGGVALKYSSGPLFVSLISEKEYTQDISNPNKVRHSLNNYLAVVYQMGSFVPTFVFHTYDGYYAYPPYVGFDSKGWVSQLGFRWHPTKTDMMHFSYVHSEDDNNTAIGTANGVTAGVIHHMTNQTDLYLLVAHIWNDEKAALAYPVTWTGDAIPLQGQNPSGFAVGIRYKF